MWSRLALAAALALSLASARDATAAGEISGSFRLAKDAYCVGEPILVQFTARNDGRTAYSFPEGGDYRGTLRHHRYSFRVTNEAGRDFTQEIWGHFGGLEQPVEIRAGGSFESSQLLNAWMRLAPPGRYRVHCRRKLGGGDADEPADAAADANTVMIEQDLKFEIVPYDKDRIVAAVTAQRGQPRYDWAIADLNAKFETGVEGIGDRKGADSDVLAALPKAWNDGYWLERDLRENRNWLTPEKPEDFLLTFSVRNNGPAALAHDLAESTLSVNGVAVTTWTATVKKLLADAKVAASLAPGAAAVVTAKMNEVLPASGTAHLVWKSGRATRRVDVRFGQ